MFFKLKCGLLLEARPARSVNYSAHTSAACALKS